MNLITLLVLTFTFSLHQISLINLLIENKLNNDTLFFIISSIILEVSLCIFYFYFIDYFISIIFSILLTLNLFLLNKELKKVYKRYDYLSIPYFIFSIYILTYLIIHF